MQLFSDVVFVEDESGAMRHVDATLERAAGSRLVPAAAADVSFAAQASDPQLADMALPGGGLVGFGVASAAGVSGGVEDDVVRYEGVRAESDLELSATATGIKESIVLKSPVGAVVVVVPVADVWCDAGVG